MLTTPSPRRSAKRLALLIGLPVALVASLVGGGLLLADRSGKPAAGATASASPSLSEAQRELQRRQAEADAVQKALGAAVADHGAALLAGDRDRFLGFAAPTAKKARTWLVERYDTLRAMGIAQWQTEISHYTPSGGTRYQATVGVKYCFSATCHTPMSVQLRTTWDLADRSHPKILEMYEYASGEAAPPWAQSKLSARLGARVVVATTAAYAKRLPSILKTAEAAAKIADGFAGANRPGRYVVYLAGDKEWKRWPYRPESSWVAGYANANSEMTVIRLSALDNVTLSTILRHEFAHVATLAAQSGAVEMRDAWWLTEGLAEYAASGDVAFGRYYRSYETGVFVRRKFRGDLRIPWPSDRSSVLDASGRYGAAYLAVRCVAQKYGRARLLAFFHDVAVNAVPLGTAAPQRLGAPWSTVSRTCAAQVRKTAT